MYAAPWFPGSLIAWVPWFPGFSGFLVPWLQFGALGPLASWVHVHPWLPKVPWVTTYAYAWSIPLPWPLFKKLIPSSYRRRSRSPFHSPFSKTVILQGGFRIVTEPNEKCMKIILIVEHVMPMNIGSSEWQFCLDVVLRKSQSREILNVDEQRLENAFDCQPRIEVNTTFLEHRPRVKVWKPQPKKPNEKKGRRLANWRKLQEGACELLHFGPRARVVQHTHTYGAGRTSPKARVVLHELEPFFLRESYNTHTDTQYPRTPSTKCSRTHVLVLRQFARYVSTWSLDPGLLDLGPWDMDLGLDLGPLILDLGS